MRTRYILAVAASAALALPGVATAHGKDDGWKKARWDARAHIKPTAQGEDARGAVYLKQGTKSVTVALRVGKLEPNSLYAAQIEQAASCAVDGAVTVKLPDLFTDEDGGVRLWITVPTAAGVNVAMTGYTLAVRPYGASGAPADDVACGEIQGPSHTKAAARVRPSVDGSEVRGSVFAKQTGTDVRVEIHLRGLVAGSAHAQHLHVGSCQAQGDVVVPLPDITADADGEYHAIQTVANAAANVVNGGYYYNLHAAAGATPGDGIACGDLRSIGRHAHGKGPWWFGPRWWGW